MSMLLRRRYEEDANTDTNTGVIVKEAVAPKSSAKKAEEKEPEFTEEKINKLNGAQLRKLASKNGVESPEELTAGELKAILIEKLV